MTDLKRIWKNDYIKIGAAIGLVVAIVLTFFLSLGLALGNTVPLRVVESGSMCTELQGCDGWSHPFDSTLHVGDVIIVQSVDPKDLNVNYPNSDIIVYQNPSLRGNPLATPIVHRIVDSYEVNDTFYFQTKGDGNGVNWPAPVNPSEYDSHNFWTTGEGVPQDLVLGKVVMRIPYLGWITLFMHGNSWALPSVIGLIALLMVVEFVVPLVRQKSKKKGLEEQNPMP